MYMKAIATSVLATAALLGTVSAHAGVSGVYQGYVKSLIAGVSTNKAVVFIVLEGGAFAPGQTSACPYNGNAMVYAMFRGDNPTFAEQDMISLALAAKNTGKQILVYGNGTCSSNIPFGAPNRTEGVKYIELKD